MQSFLAQWLKFNCKYFEISLLYILGEFVQSSILANFLNYYDCKKTKREILWLRKKVYFQN